MKTWLQDNIIQMLVILASITFGYAHFTAIVSSTADAQIKLEERVDRYEEKIDQGLKMLERIDERTKKL